MSAPMSGVRPFYVVTDATRTVLLTAVDGTGQPAYGYVELADAERTRARLARSVDRPAVWHVTAAGWRKPSTLKENPCP